MILHIPDSPRAGRSAARLFSGLLVLAALLLPSLLAAQTPKLVVVLPLDLRQAKIDEGTKIALEESIRTQAGEALLGLGYTVLSGENTLALLADNGIDPDKVCETECALETARELSAELFISGTMALTEGYYTAFIRLYESKSGKQLGYLNLEGETVREVRQEFTQKANSFFSRLLGESSAPSSPPTAATPHYGAQQVETPRAPTHPPADQNRFGFGTQPAQTIQNTAMVPATLTVITEPSGVEILVDGQQVGQSPLVNVPTQAGNRRLSTRSRCFYPEQRDLLLVPSERHTEHLQMRPKTVAITVAPQDPYGRPITGHIMVDGKAMGVAPGSFDLPVCSRNMQVHSSVGTWTGQLALNEQSKGTIVTMVSPRGANVGTVQPQEASAVASPHMAGKPKSRSKSSAFRGGMGATTGWMGLSYEFRSSNFGFAIGAGIPSLIVGFTYGAPLDRSGFYATTLLVTQFIAPYALSYSSFGPDFGEVAELGVVTTLGWDFRILSWGSIKLGAGAYMNDRTDILPVVDLELGLVF